MPNELLQARRSKEKAAAEEGRRLEAGQLEAAEVAFRRVLVALREAGYPGVETRYRRTYPPKHWFTSTTKLRKVEIGKGWRVGGLSFRWTAPPGDYNVTERVVQRSAMVLPLNGSIVHAELDDVEISDRDEKFIRTSEQLYIVVERLSAYLP